MPEITIAATGHRPDKLGGYSATEHGRIYKLAHDYLSVQLGCTTHADEKPARLISGMAIGWDIACAEAAIDLGIPLICAIPFPQQPSRWPPVSVMLWAKIKAKATEVHTVSTEFTRNAFQLRNIWMVDRADLILALWNGTAGGTANCIKYAVKKQVPVYNLWNIYKEPAQCQ